MTRYRVTVPMVCAKTSDTSTSGSGAMVNAYLDELLPVSVLPAEVERLLADRFIEPVQVAEQLAAA